MRIERLISTRQRIVYSVPQVEVVTKPVLLITLKAART